MTPEENYLMYQLKDELERALTTNRDLCQQCIRLSIENQELLQREFNRKIIEFNNRLNKIIK